ncbi:MAG: hypothetical protein KBB39_13170 [Phycicoccus sp.]|nr:hypothetical protein [Phycicoccus sp.]
MVQQPAPEFDPVVDLQRFLQFASGTAQAWQDQLSQAQAALNRLEAAAEADATPLVLEPLAADTTRAILPHLVSTARGTVRSYVMDLDGGPAGADEVGQAGQDRIRSGRSFWTLYPSTILGTTAGISFTSGRAAWGEVQRVCPATQTQFVLLGDDLVLTVAAWGDPSQGYVLVREPLVVAAFRAYFDASWATARSLTRSPSMPLDDERLLELLGFGLKDEAIARIMGLGLRTIRRRIAGLMAAHGVETRFQLGAALERAAREAAATG